MSLVNQLMGGVGAVSIDASKYTHSTGASRIAMESAAELHEIFVESFYNVEQAEIAAAVEGVALEGSQYQAVAEASIGNAFTKIKEFFKKLIEKVKAFFHAIKRFLDSIFMSGAEFVKRYEKDIKAIKGLKNYTVTMYKYDDDKIASAISYEFSDAYEKAFTTIGANKSEIESWISVEASVEGDKGDPEAKLKTLSDDISNGNFEKGVIKEITGNKCKDPEEFDECLFGMFRNGATDETDKEEIEITDVVYYMNILKNSSKVSTNIDKIERGITKEFNKAISLCDKVASNLDKMKGETNTINAKIARNYSTMAGTASSCYLKFITAWKQAFKDRDSDYKKVIMGAFTNAKKNNKNK